MPSSTTLLNSSSGVAIAAGPNLEEHCKKLPLKHRKKKNARCFTGEAVITPSFDLPVQLIVHTVGPRFTTMPAQTAEELLRQCYRSSLAAARGENISRIAFPAIACGNNQFPVHRAAAIATSVCRENSGGFKEIHFIVHNEEPFERWKEAAGEQVGTEEAGPSAEGKRSDVTLKYYYVEIENEWPVPERMLDMEVRELLYEEAFRVYREEHLASVGICDSVLTVPTVYPDGFDSKPLKELISSKGFLVFKPLASTPPKDLLYKQAIKYQELLKKDPRVDLVDYSSEIASMKAEMSSLKKNMEDKISGLEKELVDFEQKLVDNKKDLEQKLVDNKKDFEQKLENTEKKVADIETRLQAVIDRLRGFDLIMARKLLDKCRAKVKAKYFPGGFYGDWNNLPTDADIVEKLELDGLPKASLEATGFGRGTIQSAGDAQAQDEELSSTRI